MLSSTNLWNHNGVQVWLPNWPEDKTTSWLRVDSSILCTVFDVVWWQPETCMRQNVYWIVFTLFSFFPSTSPTTASFSVASSFTTFQIWFVSHRHFPIKICFSSAMVLSLFHPSIIFYLLCQRALSGCPGLFKFAHNISIHREYCLLTFFTRFLCKNFLCIFLVFNHQATAACKSNRPFLPG